MKKVTLIFLFVSAIFNSAIAFDGMKKKPLRETSNEFLGIQKFNKEGGGSFEQGTVVISAGYGFSASLSRAILKAYDNELNYTFSGLGPIHFKAEIGLSDKIGLVASINHSSFSATWNHYDATNTVHYYDKFTYTSTSFLGRMNIHFATTDKLDPYWGIGAGYRLTDYNFTSTDITYDIDIKSPFVMGFETTLGLRYYFSDNVGIYTELGFAKSIIQGGLAVKF